MQTHKAKDDQEYKNSGTDSPLGGKEVQLGNPGRVCTI
jgi:hypothetical protein